MSNKGFSLIELMISIAILAFISIMVTQTTVRSFQLREDLATEGEFNNSIRLASGVMERDISQVFSPIMMMPKPNPSATPGMQQQTTAANPFPFWGNPTDASGVRSSRFQGTDRKMSFITASNERVYKDAKESIFAKITYSLEPDPKPEPGLEGTMALFRTINTRAFELELDEKYDKTYKILAGIKSGAFKYFLRGRDIWQTSWDTESQDYRNHYPDTVEIQMEILGSRQMSFSGRYRYRLEVPIHGLFPST